MRQGFIVWLLWLLWLATPAGHTAEKHVEGHSATLPELLINWKPKKGDLIDGKPYAGDPDANGPWSKTKRLPELHHLVGVQLLKTMHSPVETMPLGDKKELVCKTCHGTKKIEELAFDKVDKKAEDFLKGGPYEPLTDFCYKCHEKKEHERPNIHMMLDKQGKIIEKTCKYCHAEVLKRDRTYKTEELKLRMPRETLCFGCHLKTPHLNAFEHQVKPSQEKLKQLQESIKKLGIILPLNNKGEMMCVTCHSPHPNGVLDNKLAAAKQVPNTDLKAGVSYKKHPWSEVYAADKQLRLEKFNRENKQHLQLQYERITAEVLLRLPAKDGSLCLACHTFTDREY
ncbi:MAG: hypothetical protein ABL903_07580 [Methylococcales bacterium]